MPADLSGIRMKLARSKHDLDALSDKVAAYMNPPPFEFVIKSKGNSYAIVCRIRRKPDPEWVIDLGAIGYQARSALDLLIVQLAIDSGNTPGKRTQFPIFTDRDQYVAKGRRGKSHRDVMLDGVASRHRRVIDNLQPYQRGRRVDDDPLAILATLSNRDEHRDVHFGLASIQVPRFGLLQPNGELQTIELVGDKFRGYPMTDGQELISIENFPPPEATNVKAQLKVLDMNVTLGFLGDRVITVADIDRTVLHVVSIVERFAKRIKP